MKKIFSAILVIWMLLLYPAVSVSAEVDEIVSPPVSFFTTKRETGEIEVTLNWENQAMTAFDYAVVYDQEKVKVKSVRFKGEFLSKYTGDTNGYGGMAVANDNGGYVVLGGIFEVQKGYTAPVYNGVIATIVLVPKTSDTEPPASAADSAAEDEPPSTPIPDFDAGTLQLVEGASNYNNGEEILNAAHSAPAVSYRVNDVINSEPVQKDRVSPTESAAEFLQEEQTSLPEEGSATSPTASEAEVSGGAEGLVSGEAVNRTEPAETAPAVKTDQPKKNDHQKEKQRPFPTWILIAAVGVLTAAVVVVIRAKKAQEKQDL